jgi:hypothetical protein
MADDFTIAQFRSDFPEFASSTKYTDATITFWAGIADKLLNVERWDDLLLYGTELFIAHNLVSSVLNVADEAAGDTAGMSSAPYASESAGGVSASFDNSSILVEGAGDFNSTNYGRRFMELAKIVGMGGAYV